MENIPREVTGEGDSFEEAANDAVEKRYRMLEAEGVAPETRDWVKVIRLEVQAEPHNQWVRLYRAVIAGK